jgi:hypothetical protein
MMKAKIEDGILFLIAETIEEAYDIANWHSQNEHQLVEDSVSVFREAYNEVNHE